MLASTGRDAGYKSLHPTHSRFLESLSTVPHLESVLDGRHIGFLNSLKYSLKSVISLIYSSTSADLSTLTGQNTNFLLQKYKKQDVKTLTMDKNIIKKARVHPINKNEAWKVELIKEICLIKKDHVELNFDDKDIDDILEYVCTQ